jgi:uncharacterized repeat protein (TIGR03837 family)
MLWDLFCRVVDNFGDAGVCWRLARGLAARGARVRLWIDDARPLAWMAPEGAQGIECRAFDEAGHDSEPGQVVIEAFGCDPPAAFIARMALQRPAPVWINLEYLSAEPYVERSHGLRSPQLSGPGVGLDKWFFYPGFSDATGGLLPAPTAVEPRAWLASRGWAPAPHERVVLLFCYANPALPKLLEDLGSTPTMLLAAPGPAQAALAAAAPPALRAIGLPYLDQADFDQVVTCADLAIVRGEDSFAQACQSGRPFLWQAYPQADGAHGPKLEAFLDCFMATAQPQDEASLRTLWRGWNGLGPWPARWPEAPAWQAACRRWHDARRGHDDLITRLMRFVDARR